MLQIIDYLYDDNVIEKIKDWRFGMNWPSVYIVYNSQKAYVGETLDAVRRTEQHLKEDEFKHFTNICLISDKTFNKSVVLDLESFLIKYMSADASKELTNGNTGVVNHNYFYKEFYEDDFKEIWSILLEKRIVSKTLVDIENSELFKYSPYKSLNQEQQKATYEILKRAYEINNATKESMIQVVGGAGTGKTILAVYLMKLIVDIHNGKQVWKTIDDVEDAAFIQKMSERISGIKNVGLVVPMVELRNTMKSIFKSIDGLNEKMVLSPDEVIKNQYDILIVDEAHRLYRRNSLPGPHIYSKFDKINKELMSDFTGSVNDLTELDWIIKSSRIQILFYDQFQTIRATDIDKKRFDSICRPHLYKYIELFSQMRCKGGNGYYEYVKMVLTYRKLNPCDFRKINGYHIEVVENVQELFEIIEEKDAEEGLSRVVSGPGWNKEEKLVINGQAYRWANDRKVNAELEQMKNTVFSIHKIQGFDLNYAGVIFGKELYYDSESGQIEVNKKELKDNLTKSSGDETMRQFILNIYLTLMTRGIHGTYVCALDEALKDYLKEFFR